MEKRDCVTCQLHGHLEGCLTIIKKDINDAKDRVDDMSERLSATEPTVLRNKEQLDILNAKITGILVSSLFCAVTIVAGLIYTLVRHVN